MSDELARARAILREHPVLDGHNDLPWVLREEVGGDLARRDLREHRLEQHTDLPRLRAGGVGGQFWSVYVPAELEDAAAVAATFEQIDLVHALCRTYDDLELVRTADEAEAAMTAGRIASFIGMEGGHSIGSSLETLRATYDAGARYLTLTHSLNVPWADSATDEPACDGLSDLGVAVVHEMNRLGMLVDLSHVAPSTMHDALDVSSAPVIFSHSSARALCDHPRNVPDDVLRRLADNGGVCQVTFVPEFISSRPGATLAQVADHVEHVARVAGIEHVGLGGDFDGTTTTVVGLEDVSTYPGLIAELLSRGWSKNDVAGLTCRNVLRALRDAEASRTRNVT